MDLTPVQEEELEDRLYKKMKVKYDSTVENAINKAGFVLKMTIPEAYQKKKTEELQRQMSRKASQNIQQ